MIIRSNNSIDQRVLRAIKSITGNCETALHEPQFRGNEWKYLKDCIDSTYVSSIGKYVDRFEKKLVEREEELFLNFTYANELIKKTIFILLIIILLAFFVRKRRIFLPVFNEMERFFGRTSSLFAIVLRPKEFFIIITAILFLWIWTRAYWYYPLLTFVLLLFFTISIVRFIKSRN